MEEQDKNCISYWFPKLQASGVLMPETRILKSGCEIVDMIDGKTPEGYDDLLATLKFFAREVGGFPIFLRTGHASAKHSWERTCYVESEEGLASNVMALVEETSMLGMFGLPLGVWAVRELLPLSPEFEGFVAFHGKMPIRRERRVFIRDGVVEEIFPYWPEAAIRDASHVDWKERLEILNAATPRENDELMELSGKVAVHFEGYWSLDWCWSRAQWYAIDMALGDQSWHPLRDQEEEEPDEPPDYLSMLKEKEDVQNTQDVRPDSD